MAEHVILVVDDEEAQRTVLAGFLRKRGFEVLTSAGVDEALKLAASRTIDLVLTDLKMSGKTGVDLLDGIREINPEVPVVLMTAFGTVASAVDAMKRGAADFLTKPIDLDQLEVLVGRTLERRALVFENRELRRQALSALNSGAEAIAANPFWYATPVAVLVRAAEPSAAVGSPGARRPPRRP